MLKIKEIVIVFFLLLISLKISFAFEEYYWNVDSNFEFKTIASEIQTVGVEKIPTISGSFQNVKKEAIINSSDILGITIDDMEIKIHFTRNSWWKIRKLSSDLHGFKMAFIKNDKVISSVTIASTFDRTAILSIPKELNLDWFLDGLVLKEPPEILNSEDNYIQFLETWIADNPDDSSSLRTIAFHYIPDDDFSKCESVIPYLKQILINNPNDFEMGVKMIKCLLNTQKNEKALITANFLLDNTRDDILRSSIIIFKSEIYYRLGMLNEAIQQTEIALNFFKNLKMPALLDWKDTPVLQEEQRNNYKNIREESISTLEKRLYSLKKELKKGQSEAGQKDN